MLLFSARINKLVMFCLTLFACFITFVLFQRKPLVSVIIPTYNRAEYISEAIESVLKQTYTNFELIIINDGSTDETQNIIEEYAKKDKRIKIFKNEVNKNTVYSRNKGISHAKGKYIAWLDDDDVYMENKLEAQVEFMEKNQDIVLSGTDISLKNGDNRRVYLGPVEYDTEKAEIVFLLERLPVILGTTIWRADFFKKYNIKFNPEFALPEDLWIYDRIFANKGKIVTIPKTLYKYRAHHDYSDKHYEKIGKNMDYFFKNRWRTFFPNDEYPEKACPKLKYIQEHNHYFNQKTLDKLYKRSCKTGKFLPTANIWFIPFEDGEEAVVVSNDKYTFYSYKMKKFGKLVRRTDDFSDVLWHGEKDVIRYKK